MAALSELRSLRMSREDSERVALLKKRMANLVQTQFMAGGDNEKLKQRCDELARQIRAIEVRYES